MGQSVMVSDFEHKEMCDMFIGQLQEKIALRKAFYIALCEADNDPLTTTPFKPEQLDDYKKGTLLLESSIKLFKNIFGVG